MLKDNERGRGRRQLIMLLSISLQPPRLLSPLCPTLTALGSPALCASYKDFQGHLILPRPLIFVILEHDQNPEGRVIRIFENPAHSWKKMIDFIVLIC